jgi:hypothetical protein
MFIEEAPEVEAVAVTGGRTVLGTALLPFFIVCGEVSVRVSVTANRNVAVGSVRE